MDRKLNVPDKNKNNQASRDSGAAKIMFEKSSW